MSIFSKLTLSNDSISVGNFENDEKFSTTVLTPVLNKVQIRATLRYARNKPQFIALLRSLTWGYALARWALFNIEKIFHLGLKLFSLGFHDAVLKFSCRCRDEKNGSLEVFERGLGSDLVLYYLSYKFFWMLLKYQKKRYPFGYQG